jgi:CBS domain-containing protein
MRISDVLRRKGARVVTVTPATSVRDLLAMLDDHHVGALVVSTDGSTLAGIVSERDVVRHLHRDGPAVLDAEVGSIMTAVLHTCEPTDTVVDVMRTMTQERVRHVPVVVDGRLAGIVSIGDVVKHRIDELAYERDQLDAYIHS